MRILILGGHGLIGAALTAALSSHSVSILSRSAQRPDDIKADFADLTSPQNWIELGLDFDVVVNAVGIFSETNEQTFQNLHVDAPLALFKACEQIGLRRVIQISALGADVDATTPYWRSKGEADAALAASTLDWTIVRPSLIYAPNGTSSQVFCQIASLPVLAHLQDCGDVQPIHLDDVTLLLIHLIEEHAACGQIVDAVGPTAMPLHQWWQALRHAMQIRNTISIKVYAWQQELAVHSCQYIGNTLLSRDSLSMLRLGNTADVSSIQQLLGRPPKAAVPDLLQASPQRQTALLSWLLPLLRLSLAAVWLITAWVSWVYPRADSFALLAQAGIPEHFQATMFYGSVAMDVAFGVACLLNQFWRLQLLLVLFYSLIIAIKIPEYLWHPFGPLLKNLPILALLLMFNQLKAPQIEGK